VRGLTQASSGCQEGNSIEVRNAPFDGTHPGTVNVEIANNTVSDFMKTGILVNGDVNATVRNNSIGASANQTYLAANSIQFGYGASGVIKANRVDGNQWCTAAGDIATAILLYEANVNTGLPIAANVNVTQNILSGNADVGIYAYGNGMTVNNNKVFDDGSITDCNVDGYDVGIFNETWGGAGNNVFKNNKVGGYTDAYLAVSGGNNKTNPNK
jgi:parallel beta-helix repeat protein